MYQKHLNNHVASVLISWLNSTQIMKYTKYGNLIHQKDRKNISEWKRYHMLPYRCTRGVRVNIDGKMGKNFESK